MGNGKKFINSHEKLSSKQNFITKKQNAAEMANFQASFRLARKTFLIPLMEFLWIRLTGSVEREKKEGKRERRLLLTSIDSLHSFSSVYQITNSDYD